MPCFSVRLKKKVQNYQISTLQFPTIFCRSRSQNFQNNIGKFEFTQMKSRQG